MFHKLRILFQEIEKFLVHKKLQRTINLEKGYKKKKKRKKFAALTNREELSFFTVLAFPKASKIGFACKSCCSNSPYHQKLIILIKMKIFNLFYSMKSVHYF